MTSSDLTLSALESLREGVDVEVKAGQGRDGTGAVPDDLWRSYAAMANTRGGRIVLGVREKPGRPMEVVGLANPERVLRDLWATVNNPTKVSACVLSNEHVQVTEMEGHAVVVIDVPRARRADRPVYLNNDPFEVYVRLHEADVRVKDRDRVRRMIADGQQDSRDGQILDHLGVDDVDPTTLRAYRMRFRDNEPDHPWLALPDRELLVKLGAIRRDRASGKEGLTLAGLLAFGSHDALRDHRPGHMLDYQLRRDLRDRDWLDREFPNGLWSGNLFDFYGRVMPKLVDGLLVPFALGPGLFRRSESHVHEAIREALVNCLIHADHEASSGIVIVRTPDGLLFENPGLPRVPLEQMLEGGVSDCRNKTLQKIFLLVGLGEQAGSGYARILRAWGEQHWALPELVELVELDRTRLRLPLVSLFPPAVMKELEREVPDYSALDELDRLILAVAAAEGAVTNRGLQDRSRAHGRDLTFRLRALVDRELLAPHGERAGRSYTPAWRRDDSHITRPISGGDRGSISGSDRGSISGSYQGTAADGSEPSDSQPANEPPFGGSSGADDGKPSSAGKPFSGSSGKPFSGSSGKPFSGSSGKPFSGSSDGSRFKPGEATDAHNLEPASTEEALRQIATTSWAPTAHVLAAVLRACRDRWLSLDELSAILNRKRDTVLRSYVTPLVRAGRLERRHESATHPDQAYRTVAADEDAP
jgi:predicted HTH transcriptional regulator